MPRENNRSCQQGDEAHQGRRWNPTLKRAYVRGEGGRGYAPIGWYCPQCQFLQPEEVAA